MGASGEQVVSDDEEDDIVEEIEMEPSCLEISDKCEDNEDCCDGLLCHKRDMVCKNPPRQSKVSMD